MTKKMKRMVATGAIMGLMSSVVFTGCGKKNDTTGTTILSDPNGMSYVADFYDFKDANGKKATLGRLLFNEDKLYASGYVDEDGNGFVSCLNVDNMQPEGFYNFSEAVQNVLADSTDLPENIGEYETGVSFEGLVFTENGIKIFAEWYAYNYSDMDPDDGLYSENYDFDLGGNDEDADSEDEYSLARNYVIEYDNNYQVTNVAELNLDYVEKDEYIQQVFDDDNGHLVLAGSHNIYFTDYDFNLVQNVHVSDNWINDCFIGENGYINVVYCTDNWDMIAGKVSANSSAVEEGINLKDNYANGYLLSSTDSNILYYYDTYKLCSRDLTSGEDTDIIKWLDVDIDGGSSVRVCEGKDGCFYVGVTDYTVYESQIAVVYQKSNAEIVTKTEIRVAALYNGDGNMQSAMAAFNKSQDKYRIVADYYYDWEKYGDNYDDAITNLNNAIIGSDAPDIVSLEGLEVRSLVNKGVLEDLTGYVANSNLVNIEDYNEKVIKAFTIDGKLISIPRSFNLMTIIVNANDFENKDSWTMEEMIDYVNAHPGAQLEAYITRNDFIDTFLSCNLNEYIDWSTGSCDFNKSSFRKALEFAATVPESYDWNNIDYDFNISEALSQGQVLTQRMNISETTDVQMVNAYFKIGAKYIGFPNAAGVNTHVMSTGTGYSILSTSQNKEGAWEFIEFYLNRERSDWDYNFPSKISELQAQYDKELEHAGEPNGSGMVDDTGWEYEFHYSTQEEIDQINALIDNAIVVQEEPEIMSIIEEEASGYFSGQKSLDEVINLIQSRVQIYVSERV